MSRLPLRPLLLGLVTTFSIFPPPLDFHLALQRLASLLQVSYLREVYLGHLEVCRLLEGIPLVSSRLLVCCLRRARLHLLFLLLLFHLFLKWVDLLDFLVPFLSFFGLAPIFLLHFVFVFRHERPFLPLVPPSL